MQITPGINHSIIGRCRCGVFVMTPRYCSFFSIYPQSLESEFSGTDVLVIRDDIGDANKTFHIIIMRARPARGRFVSLLRHKMYSRSYICRVPAIALYIHETDIFKESSPNLNRFSSSKVLIILSKDTLLTRCIKYPHS